MRPWFAKLSRWPALPVLLLILAQLFWAGNGVLGQGVRGVIPPISLAFWRWVLAFFFSLPFTWPHLRRDWPVVRANWPIILILSLTGITLFNTIQYAALQTTSAINSSLLQTLMPSVIILLSWILFREKISGRQGVGVLICIAGAVLVVTRADWAIVRGLRFVWGDILILIGVLVYALYSVLLSRRPAMSGGGFLAWSFLLGFLMLSPAYLWELSTAGGFALTWPVAASLLYVGIFPSILSFLCWNYGVVVLGSNRSGLFVNLLPVFTAALSILLLGEIVRWFHLAGLVLIFGGMLLFNRARRMAWQPAA